MKSNNVPNAFKVELDKAKYAKDFRQFMERLKKHPQFNAALFLREMEYGVSRFEVLAGKRMNYIDEMEVICEEALCNLERMSAHFPQQESDSGNVKSLVLKAVRAKVKYNPDSTAFKDLTFRHAAPSPPRARLVLKKVPRSMISDSPPFDPYSVL